MVYVPKKDGSLRLCIDYRAINEKSQQRRRPLPRIQDSIDSLGGGDIWFSTFDQGKAGSAPDSVRTAVIYGLHFTKYGRS